MPHRDTAAGPEWQPARAQSTSRRIEGQIKQAVLDGRLKPGDFLGSENELAGQFGVSRLPVREALGRLHALGIVDVRTGAGGGARIASGDPSHVAEALAIQLVLTGLEPAEIFDAQQVIEVAAAGMAAEHRTAGDLERLDSALAGAAALVDRPDAFTPASMQFHCAVVDAAHNDFLSAMMRAIATVLQRAIAPNTTVPIASGVIAKHRRLLAAIEAKDAALARQLTERHLSDVRRTYFARKGGRGSAGVTS